MAHLRQTRLAFRSARVPVLSVLLALLTTARAQQDPQFSQYMFNLLAINPAYAGYAERISLKALSRHQWVGFDGAPATQTITGHSPLFMESFAIGGTLVRDQHGPITQYNLMADAAYRIFLSGSKLAFGLRLGGNMLQGKFGELSPERQGDPVFQQSVQTKLDPQFGFGVMWYSDRWFVGASTPKMLGTKFFDQDTLQFISPPGQRSHWFISAGYVFDLSMYTKFKPTVIFKTVDGAPLSFDLNANFLLYDKFWLGALYRHQDAVGAMAQYLLLDGLSLGYSYDLTLSTLRNYNTGTHEVLVGYEFGKRPGGIRSPRYF
jgi:type IX secretion system PorP/SprF family membrane protein